MMFNRAALKTLFGKELTEILRDRRTLFVMLVMPFISYPLIIVIMLQLTLSQAQKIQDQTAQVAFTAPDLDPALAMFLNEKADELHLELIVPHQDENVNQAVLQNTYAAAIESIPPADDTVSGGITIFYNAADEKSGMVRQQLNDVLMEYTGGIVIKRLKNLGKPRTFIEPYTITSTNVAPREQVGAFYLGRNITLIMIIMVIVGAFYPALEVTAGERERRTLETLLVSPAGRMEIVCAKYLAVFLSSFVTGILNLGSMVLTFSLLMPKEVSERFPVALSLSTIAVTVFILIPLSAFIAAVFLGFSTFAKSYKEGQSYLSPLVMLLSMPAMITVVPGASLNIKTAFIPVANIALLCAELMMKEVQWGLMLLVIAVTGFYAWLALTWSARLFEGESIIFRVGNPFKQKGLSALHAFILTGIALALMIYGGAAGGSEPSVFWALIFHQLGYIALALLIAKYLGKGIKATCSFALKTGPADWRHYAGSIVFMIGVIALMQILFADQAGADQELLQPLLQSLELSLAMKILFIAVLPGIAEELLFRGPILAGLRRSFGNYKGALMCGLLFGFLHVIPAKILPTAVMGFAFAIIVIKTGSIIPAIILHIINNALGVLMLEEQAASPMEPGMLWLIGGIGIVGIVLGFWLMRSDKDPAAVTEQSVIGTDKTPDQDNT